MKNENLKEDKLNIDFNAEFNELPQQKKSHKKLIISGIILGTILLVVATTLLIGYTKFNWFQSQKDEIYNLNIELKKSVNQIQYFKETKTIKTTTGYNNGQSTENTQNVDTNFMVAITDKKDSKNSAVLVILDSTVQFEDKSETISSFDILNEKVVHEFELDPDESKYPMAKFTFDDKGKIIDILLPEKMDRYNAQSLIEIIEGVTPKLTRNKTEDIFAGVTVEVSDSENGKGKTEIENVASREYIDRYTNKRYHGSNFQRKIHRLIEDKEIKNINTDINLLLKTEKLEGENDINIGFDYFNVDYNSNVNLIRSEEDQKEFVQLIEKLSQLYKYKKSDELIKEIISKEEEEQIKQQNDEIEEETRLRKLGKIIWEGKFEHEKEIFSFNVLGQKVAFIYSVTLHDGYMKNVLFVKCGQYKIEIGNKGVNLPKKETNKVEKEKTLLKFPFPGIPFLVNIEFLVGGEFDYEILIKLNKDSLQEFRVTFTGAVYGKALARAGVKDIAEVSAGVKGDIISAKAETQVVKKSKKYALKTSIKFSTARIELFIKGMFVWLEIFHFSFEVFKGIGLKTITF